MSSNKNYGYVQNFDDIWGKNCSLLGLEDKSECPMKKQ